MNDPVPPEEAIFEAALALPISERAAYLDGACGGNAALRQLVEDLLAADEAAGEFLEHPAPGAETAPAAGPQSPRAGAETAGSAIEKSGDKIGHYKLLQQIGEGGCGVVYMAEQEEPVHRRVALKVIKLGMDTKNVIARFEAERQALALMDHPNIAKVLDAGATNTGRPYFVMELVRGTKITDYCDANNLSTGERLGLFIQVCRAIQHAHQKGVIHRDIKPSNILVTMSDGVPVPKVIDFGIAKATHGKLTDKTLFTAFEQFIGTPAYMSPEQAELSAQDIDTRSDIYSLGVLLYELLTGQTPFDAKKLLQAGLDEIRRTIREEEPARPSTCLSTMLAGELKTAARQRQTEPPRLIHLVRGDLDWIVMKALEKDRPRRYETANGFAADIQRHLNNEPVVASPPGNLYRFQKLVRRNKLVFTAAGFVMAALVLGLVMTTWMFFKEQQARRQTEAERAKTATEAAKSRQVAHFLENMLEGVGPSVALGRDTKMLREILDKTAERVGKDLHDQPEVEIELRYILAKTYSELGLYQQQADMAREGLRLSRLHLGSENSSVANALFELGYALVALGDLDQAEINLRAALAMNRKLPGDNQLWIAADLTVLANVLNQKGKLAEAEQIFREALVIRRKKLGAENGEVAKSLNNLGTVLAQEGKLADAEPMFRAALTMGRKLFGDEHPQVSLSLNNLALVLRDQGKPAEAESLQRQALAEDIKLLGNDHPSVAMDMFNLALMLDLQGKLAEAEALDRQVIPMLKKSFGDVHPQMAIALGELASLLASEKKLAEAETVNREALALYRKSLGNDHPYTALSLENLANLLLQESKPDEAETTARECLAIRKKQLPDDPSTFGAEVLVGSVLLEQKKYAEAEPFLLEGYQGMKQREAAMPPTATNALPDAIANIIRLYESTGRSDEAARWKAKLLPTTPSPH